MISIRKREKMNVKNGDELPIKRERYGLNVEFSRAMMRRLVTQHEGYNILNYDDGEITIEEYSEKLVILAMNVIKTISEGNIDNAKPMVDRFLNVKS